MRRQGPILVPVPVWDALPVASRYDPPVPDEFPTTFDALGLPQEVVAALAAAGFETPLPVQARAVPPLLAGRSVVVSAETGSGKTLAYAAPLVASLLDGSPAAAPRVLVLVPTRELASQVAAVFALVGAEHGIVTVAAHGGTPVRIDERALEAGAHVVVATPGRLRDLARRGAFLPGALETVVVDEADRMLARDFAPHVRKLIEWVPPQTRLVLCSATVDNRVLELAAGRLDDAVRVHGSVEGDRALPPGIRHTAVIVRQPLKRLLLLHLLATDETTRLLVFVGSRFRCRALAEALAAEGVAAESLSGGRKQADRDAALDAFRAGRIRVLVATDLAERGIDLPGLTHVVNFDLPKQVTRYAHRVGRTARAFGEGVALAFVTPPEQSFVAAARKLLDVTIDVVDLPGFDFDQQPAGRDPLVAPLDRSRPGQGRTADAPRRPKKGNPAQQKKAFWDRARKAREKRRVDRGGPPARGKRGGPKPGG